MASFLREIPRLYQLWKEDKKKEEQKNLLLSQGPTEVFIRELMAQSEQGVEVSLHFPGGVSMVITRKPTSVLTQSNGITLREDYLGN
jgi:hypothetical protein